MEKYIRRRVQLSFFYNLYLNFYSSEYLTFKALADIICTTSHKVKKCYILPTEYLYVLYISQKKHRSSSHIALNDWFSYLKRQVFTVRYATSLQRNCIRFRPYMGYHVTRNLSLRLFPLLFPHLNTNWNTNKNLCYNALAENFGGTQSVSCETTARHVTQNTSDRHTYASS